MLRKGYEVTEDRRRVMNHRFGGFERVYDRDPFHAASWTKEVHRQGRGKPGLTVHHPASIEAGEPDICSSKGLNCTEQLHNVVYRDHRGHPVSYAEVENYGKPTVSMMGSNLRRGVQHAIAVGHIASHLSKMGAHPSDNLSGYSQRLVAHGADLEDSGKDNRLKNYLDRRAARVRKGYKLTREAAERARGATGAGPSEMSHGERRMYARDELNDLPSDGKPGLTIHRNKRYVARRYLDAPRMHEITYRDHEGVAVTSASVYGRATGARGAIGDRKVGHLVSDQSRGAVHALGVAHVTRVLHRLGAAKTMEMTEDSQRLVAHSMEPGRTPKLLDYMKRRAARIKKAFYHATTDFPFRPSGDYGLHAGTIRAALDRAKVHCAEYTDNEKNPISHSHYFVRIRPKFTLINGTYREPAPDEGSDWENRSTIYHNRYEHPGSRSVHIHPRDATSKVAGRVRIPEHIVQAHQAKNSHHRDYEPCEPRCIHERLVQKMVQRAAL